MKTPILFLSMMLFQLLFPGPDLFGQGTGSYFFGFSNKNGTTFSLADPAAYLSQRAIQRRQAQGIAIDSTDLPVNNSYVNQVTGAGATLLNRSRWMNGVTAFVPGDSVLNAILALPFVSNFQKVKPAVTAKIVPADESDSAPPTLSHKDIQTSFNYGNSFNQVMMLNGHILHNQGFIGTGKVIAILDAGFFQTDQYPVFDSLWAGGRILGWKDFVAFDDSVFEDHTHGMQVLSVMGGFSSGNLIGTAPGASYWLLRCEDAATEYLIEEDNWVSAAEFADSVGADIINSSLGYCTFNDASQNHTWADLDGNSSRATRAADMAVAKGMVAVVSAGNEGGSAWQRITIPSDGFNVLSIGAVDYAENYVGFSGKGPSFDGRVKPDVAAQGSTVIVQGSGGGFVPGSGTSFSAPLTAGMVACLWQANPDYTSMEIIQAVRAAGDQFFNPDSLKGYGIPDFALANLTLNGIHYHDFAREQLINTFPNPFRDYVVIDFYSPDSQRVSIDIVDLSGRVTYSTQRNLNLTTYNRIRLEDLGFLTEGFYTIRIRGSQKIYEGRLIKI